MPPLVVIVLIFFLKKRKRKEKIKQKAKVTTASIEHQTSLFYVKFFFGLFKKDKRKIQIQKQRHEGHVVNELNFKSKLHMEGFALC